MEIASDVVLNQRSRRTDRYGSGQFGATRVHRLHKGLDIVSTANEIVFSPIEGLIARESLPYRNDPSLRGVRIDGSGVWAGYKIKLFYVEGFLCGAVHPGQMIGRAQDLSFKYPGITNHVHMEVWLTGHPVSPETIYQKCF